MRSRWRSLGVHARTLPKNHSRLRSLVAISFQGTVLESCHPCRPHLIKPALNIFLQVILLIDGRIQKSVQMLRVHPDLWISAPKNNPLKQFPLLLLGRLGY